VPQISQSISRLARLPLARSPAARTISHRANCRVRARTDTYFANLVIQKDGASYELILVTVLFESVIFSVLSIVGVNTWIQNRMPQCIRIGTLVLPHCVRVRVTKSECIQISIYRSTSLASLVSCRVVSRVVSRVLYHLYSSPPVTRSVARSIHRSVELSIAARGR